jgi:hypothetical protein
MSLSFSVHGKFLQERRDGVMKKNIVVVTGASSGFGALADAIVNVVEMPFGKRPFHVHIDPAQDDGSEIVNGAANRIQAEFLHRIELGDLLAPQVDDS